MLPWQDLKTGLLTYTRGIFTGYFFSEELKVVSELGYKITPYFGYEFSQERLFDEYVDHFYKAKAETKGSERYINKLFLNGLYGFFGRSLNKWSLEFIPNNQLMDKISVYPSYELISLDDNTFLLLHDQNPSIELLNIQNKTLQDFYKENDVKYMNNVLANIAVASAITSYARIHMIPVKTDQNNPCFYTDTDSVFVQFPLEEKLVGSGLGQFKDELKGECITRAIFLNTKLYGYETATQSKVIISGAPVIQVNGNKTSTVTYEELIKIKNGETIYKQRNNIIKKSFRGITLFSYSSLMSLKFDLNSILKTPIYKEGILIGYEPPYIFVSTKLIKLSQKYYKVLKLYNTLKQTIKLTNNHP